MRIFFYRSRQDASGQKPVVIDAENYERDARSGRITYRKRSWKEKALFALQVLGGAALAAGMFVILLPIALFLAVAVVSVALAFMVVFWWNLRKHREEINQWRAYLQRLFERDQF
jgi:4-hydroxybenzoate polyprenyltransferase